MGIVFINSVNGNPVYVCRDPKCLCPFASEAQLISRNFKGSYGAAILFEKASNVILGKTLKREMLTGEHIIRPVFCKKCRTDLGWKYEYTKNDDQRYKEGKFVLEVECLKSTSGVLPSVSLSRNARGDSETDFEPVPHDDEQFQIHLDL